MFVLPFWLFVGARTLPTEVRYTGLVLAREVNAVLFASTAPFMATMLVHLGGGSPWWLAGYLALSGVGTAVSVLRLRETAPRVLARAAAGKTGSARPHREGIR
ncbi:hypothetical protein [Sciscionella marina]|uniref:hypothetical protein n=1 Tax=Sciscionella marina TaxID=508770 RepID=UPI00036C02B3|nr:hypothetical protein [Sciscionella marina]